MAAPLQGKRIALACHRRADDLAKLVTKFGGTPLLRPTMRILPATDDPLLLATMRQLLKEGADWLVFTTGVGVQGLAEVAEKLGMEDAWRSLLRSARLAARGYKTANALRSLGIADFVRDTYGTTESLLAALASEDFSDRKVAVQLFGEPVPEVTDWFRRRGAKVTELLAYRHLPSPPFVLDTLLHEILLGKVDAVLFTSAPQVRFLFAHAQSRHQKEALCDAFQRRVVAGAVGQVSAQALREFGVTRCVVPEEERMGAMVIALVRHFAPDAF
jgi:uroporphyrinogen-III synthase